MLKRHGTTKRAHQDGDTLLEVLVTLIILAFGLLGLVALQARMQSAGAEAYARAQATVLLSDITDRISANSANAASYVANGIGTGDSQPADCSTVAAGPARDVCEWSNALKGAGETKSSLNVGAMAGAQGCIESIRAPDPSPGVCIPGTYRVTIVWQGMTKTVTPAIACGQNQFGDDTLRRAVAVRINVALPTCS